MSDVEHMDLRSLAEVQSPEVVRRAVRRFRRRLLTTGAIVLLAAASLVGGILWAVANSDDLRGRANSSPGVAVGATFRADDITVVLTRVARVEEGVALGFLVAAPQAEERDRYFVRAPDARLFEEYGDARAREMYVVVAPPPSGTLTVELVRQRECRVRGAGSCSSPAVPIKTLSIDLSRLEVPETIWR